MLPIGAWVLNEACTQAHAWSHHVQGPLRIAVNLSALQLRLPTSIEQERSRDAHHAPLFGQVGALIPATSRKWPIEHSAME